MKRPSAEAIVTVLACCALWMTLGSRILPGARKHDFLNLYAGASLALDGNFRNLHDPRVQLERERKFVPETGALIPFVRPPFYAALLAPLALLPLPIAFVFWIGLQIGLLMACWYWAFARWGSDSLVFSALFLPAPIGITHGQDSVFMLAILLASFVLMETRRELGAGAMLGLGLIKFHLWLLWPLALAVQKRWRMLAGYALAAAGEALVSWWLSGTAGVLAYARMLTDNRIQQLNPAPELTVTVQAIALNLGWTSLWVASGLIAFTVALVLAASWRAPIWRWWAATATGSLLIAPHVYLYDLTLLLLPLWLVIFCSLNKPARILATFLSTPLPYLMTLVGSTPWTAIAPVTLLLLLAALAFRKQSEPFMLTSGRWLAPNRSSS